jgi:hypothetical protein
MKIHDLAARPQPAGPLLTAGQTALFLRAKNAMRPCEACGSGDFVMCPEHDARFAEERGTVLLACRQCNALRTFLRPPVMAWLREARGAD